MTSDRKFKYWHIVTAVNKFYQEKRPEISIGVLTDHYPIWNGPIFLTNLNNPEAGSYWAYSIHYIGKLPADLEGEEFWKKARELVGKLEDVPIPSDK